MKLLLKFIIPFVFIGLALLIVKVLISSRQSKPPREQVEVVTQAGIIHVEAQDHRPPVMSYGTVQSYFETTLQPEVSGQIKELTEDFRVGVQVKKNTVLARIDDTDYVAALALETANLAAAQRSLAEEEVKSRQASEDWVASGRNIASATDFVLRKPQLQAALAKVKSSQAAVDKAQADVERTLIRAPYDAVIIDRNASVGDFANQQQSLGKLVATRRVEVRLPLTAEQAARLTLPGRGDGTFSNDEPVTLRSATKAGVEWKGELVRTDPSVDPKNQVTYVIAEVADPYAASPEPLVVGTFVNASIPAKMIPASYKVAESTLVNDSFIWVLDEDNKLCRVTATRMHRHEGKVYLRISTEDLAQHDLGPALKVVIRPLANFKTGKKLKPVVQSSQH